MKEIKDERKQLCQSLELFSKKDYIPLPLESLQNYPDREEIQSRFESQSLTCKENLYMKCYEEGRGRVKKRKVWDSMLSSFQVWRYMCDSLFCIEFFYLQTCLLCWCPIELFSPLDLLSIRLLFLFFLLFSSSTWIEWPHPPPPSTAVSVHLPWNPWKPFLLYFFVTPSVDLFLPVFLFDSCCYTSFLFCLFFIPLSHNESNNRNVSSWKLPEAEGNKRRGLWWWRQVDEHQLSEKKGKKLDCSLLSVVLSQRNGIQDTFSQIRMKWCVTRQLCGDSFSKKGSSFIRMHSFILFTQSDEITRVTWILWWGFRQE